MRCCSNCFDSDYLQKQIEVRSDDKGNCSFCPTQKTTLIEPSKLEGEFHSIVGLYKKDDGSSQSLVSLLKRDWGLFSGLEEAQAKSVLQYIFGDRSKNFEGYSSILSSSEYLDHKNWDEFKKEIKHENRFFPESFPEHEKLANLLDHLAVIQEPTHLYRARIVHSGDRAYNIDQMGPPPPNVASGGRANPFGVSYLYVATTEHTAISEVRPHQNDLVSVAKFSLREELLIIDLRNPRKTICPFHYGEEELKGIYRGLELLSKLSEELTKPVNPNVAHLEYVSSQYLCEFIKSKGFAGVVYRSSLGYGDNYAIFNSSRLEGESVSLYRVSDIKVVSERLQDHIKEASQTPSIEPNNDTVKKQNRGVICMFSNEKEFGFIRTGRNKQVYFHASSASDVDLNSIREGLHVEFDEGENYKGMCATNVRIARAI